MADHNKSSGDSLDRAGTEAVLQVLEELKAQGVRLERLQRANYEWQSQHLENLRKIMNQMCEGLNVAPVVLTDNPMLSSVSPHQQQQQQQTDYRASSSASSSASGSHMSTAGRASSRQMSSAGIEGRITQLIGQAREDDIAILLRSSSLDDINRISPDTWELMVPVALSWSQHHGSEQATMSYSVMYHIMDNCASVLARPSIRNYVRRFAAACENAWHTGKDMAHAGGLSLAELGTLTSYLKQH